MLFIRALLAFLALPGLVAFVAPPLFAAVDPWKRSGWGAGIGVLLAGVVALVWCVRDFYVAGKGTLAPWDPPKKLVIVGLYRHVRNPMYLSVLTLVVGWALFFGSPLVGMYVGVLAIGFHLRVTHHEELWLAAQFGQDWQSYQTAVKRWWPRLKPWRPLSAQ